MIPTQQLANHNSTLLYHDSVLNQSGSSKKYSVNVLPSSAHVLSTNLPIDHIAQTPQTFDQLLAVSSLPPPGPEYYAARRRLWLTPPPHLLPRVPEPSSSRDKLEKILKHPGVVQSDTAWTLYLENVWKGLSAGGSLKHRLPMGFLIKIVHAAWLRDETWPVGMIAPEPDDVLPGVIESPIPPATGQNPAPIKGEG